MESTRAVLGISGNSARFYVSSPDKRTNSCDQQTEYVTLEHFRATHARLRLRLLARFGTLLLCAWPHQKPSQMFTSCLRFLCFFCFCFSVVVVDVDVVRASFITPYFMLVLAFCLLLSFRLWIVEKFFVIINFFFFWRVFWVLFSKAAFERGCGLGLWRGSAQMQKWFWQQHHLALLFLINILISVYWFMLPTEMHDEKRIQLKMLI